jgi:membrane-bound lytic murein transglycosylase B
MPKRVSMPTPAINLAAFIACALLCHAPSASAQTEVDAPTKARRHPAPTLHRIASTDTTPDLVTYGRRDDVMRFGTELAERRNLDAAWVLAALQRARFVPGVAKAIMPPPAGTAKNWAAYRARFVEAIRIRAGVAFWRANQKWLTLAEERYGVPPEIVVGIIGVETIYGQQMGNFRVIDALATLAFDFPVGRKDRSAFFRDELENFFVLCDAQHTEPLQARGSFAGAMGMPQFMPSSAIRYAIDFDDDGQIDLAGNPADVIGSVAHYLAEFGWQRGLPTRFEVAVPVDASERAVLLGPDIVPSFTAAEFTARGAQLSDAALAFDASQAAPDASASPASSAASAPEGEGNTPAPIKLALVELQNGDAAPSYVAGTANFYAVTRYNWSSYYAMAVIDLGEAVARVAR